MNSVDSPNVVAVEETPWVSGHGEKPGVERRSWLRQSGESTWLRCKRWQQAGASRTRPPRLQLVLCNPHHDRRALLCTSQLRVSQSQRPCSWALVPRDGFTGPCGPGLPLGDSCMGDL